MKFIFINALIMQNRSIFPSGLSPSVYSIKLKYNMALNSKRHCFHISHFSKPFQAVLLLKKKIQCSLCLYLDWHISFLLLHLPQQSWKQRGFPRTHMPYHSNESPLRDTQINPEEREKHADGQFKHHVDTGGIVSKSYKGVSFIHSFIYSLISISFFTSLLIEDYGQIL